MMKNRKTVFSLLFLLVLMGATWLVLKGIGKELDFFQMWRFIQTGNKGCLGAALLCISAISSNRWIPIKALLFNTAQRIAQILITSFVCVSVSTGVTFLDAMALQSFCMTGSNSIPLPGAVGAYEFLYLGTFGGVLDEMTLMPSLMTARGISYYLCFMLSCAITWVYHIHTLRRDAR